MESKFALGKLLNEGKTKRIWEVQDRDLVVVESKDDITAGDGKRHDIMPGKGKMATSTAVNVFRYLQDQGIRVAFVVEDSPVSFLAKRTNMLPYEVVIRGEADGSYCQRYPSVARAAPFEHLLVEFFLKTKERKWEEHALVCDDPLMQMHPDKVKLFDPHKDISKQRHPFLVLDSKEVYTQKDEFELFWKMEDTGMDIFKALSRAWKSQDARLVDVKIEFGMHMGKLFVSDVIDNDSWRLWREGRYIDKQRYRDGAPLEEVAKDYQLVAELSAKF